jgi:F-type H+-transporting ATPase subunit b
LNRSLRKALLVLMLGGCLLGLAGIVRAAALGPEETAAAEHEEKSEGHKHELLFKWINFVILVGGLGYVLRKPLANFFVQRSASIQKSLDEGRKALEASQAQLQAVEDRLRRFEEEMASFRAAALEEMKAEREHLRRMTATEIEKLMDSLRVQMEVATKQARLELKLYGAQQAVEMARQMIGRRLDDAGQRRLVADFVARLEAKQVQS